jgi:hypothetical protein
MCSLPLAASTVVLAACGGEEATTAEEAGAVIVTPSSAPAGSTVAAAVRNDTDAQITYGAGYELERELDGEWEQINLPEQVVNQIGYIAEPGRTGPPVQVKLPGDLEPGPYRVVLDGRFAGEFEVSDG